MTTRQYNTIPTLLTVTQFVEKYQFLSNAALRNHIFYSDQNGMDDFNVITKIGKRIYIEENNFFNWVEFKNKESLS
jgi:hypothetical protein